MYEWERGARGSGGGGRLGLAAFAAAGALAVASFLVFHPQIDRINQESPLLINAMFAPAMAVGALYGARVTARAVRPSETRSPRRRVVVKVFLFFFVIGGMFSSVSFALNGGSVVPTAPLLEVGLAEWAAEYVSANGGATFLIMSSIALMAAGTRRLVSMGGALGTLFTFVGTFIFFTMMALSFTQSSPSDAEVYLFAFYQAGVVGGALFEMNRLTAPSNRWEDYSNGY